MTTQAQRALTSSELLAWLNRKFVRDGVVIAASTPLFQGGLIDSIRILEIIAWVERALGRTIPDRDIRMDNFATVDRIAVVFLGEDENVHQ